MGILRKSAIIDFVVANTPVSSYASISKVLFYFLLPPIPGLLLLETDENSPHGTFFVKLSKATFLSSFELLISWSVFFSLSESDANRYISKHECIENTLDTVSYPLEMPQIITW